MHFTILTFKYILNCLVILKQFRVNNKDTRMATKDYIIVFLLLTLNRYLQLGCSHLNQASKYKFKVNPFNTDVPFQAV